MKSKKPLLAMAILLFWAGYSILSFSFYSISISSMNEEHTQNKKKNIDYHLDSSVDYLINDSIETLIDNLEMARKLDHFNFFLLRKDKKNIAFGTNHSNLEGIDIPFPTINEWVEDQNKTYIWKTKVINSYELTIGAVTSNTEFLLTKLNQKKYFLLAELAFVTLFSFGIIAFLFKDILKITRRLRSKETDLTNLTTLSSEAESILNAAKTLHETGAELKSTNKTYAQVITPAVLEEIRLQTPTPSSFPMTLVRVDLNGYTRIFLEKREEYISEILNLYFSRAREVIERHKGLIYQYVGDEIIFYIKDSHDYSSVLKGIFCVRQLFEIAQEIEEKYTLAENHEFKIKCSLSYGMLYFVQLDQGFGFSGLPLIESVRMLGAFTEKKENTLCLYVEDAARFQSYFEIDEKREALFKGFSKSSDVALVKKFTELKYLLPYRPLEELASIFKSDKDILFWIEQMKTMVTHGSQSEFIILFNELKEIKFEVGNKDVVQNYTQLLEWTYSEFLKDENKKVFLSALISLAFNLVPVESFTTSLFSLLEKLINVADNRTKANALIALSEFDPNSTRYKGFLNDSSNRLAGNALLIEAKKDFNSRTYDMILTFLKSDNPFFIATGLYVVEQVFKHYMTFNNVFFRSFPLFSQLKEESRPFLKSDNAMIRNRASKIPELNSHGEFKIVS